jgi:hypothetical protein
MMPPVLGRGAIRHKKINERRKKVYKKLFFTAVALTAVLVPLFITGVVAAQDENPNSSAKATALIGDLHVLAVAEAEDYDWDIDIDGSLFRPIMTQNIKTANDKDLFIDLSLQTGCYTMTQVKSKNMEKDTSLGMCDILVWVRVDGERVYPRGPIIFDSRIQRLSATLQGYIPDVDPDTGAIGEITVPEEIELFIGTLSAHAFNFIVEDLDPGMHEVKVYVMAISTAISQAGSAEARAMVGLGSMTIEEVRMVKGDDITDVGY